MQCYLVRHGEAKSEREDPARPLSDHGREEVTRVARHVGAMGFQIAEIRHSGKLRARQTAEILAEHLSPTRGLHEVEGLSPMDDLREVQAEIEQSREPLMFVGHLPHLSLLASALLRGDSERKVIHFPAAAIVCLARVDGGFRLEWVLTPDLAM
ncbi:MAG: phosphohistidine phosphatase SixA [candidate division NC10 bacterium]